MRRYYIVSRLLLILPIIGFAVAAPVLVQEKRQTHVDVGNIPGDAITMLGERGELDDLNEMLLMYEKHFAEQAESSAAHTSSSSPPSGPDHGWTLTNLRQPLPSILEEESPVSSPGHEPSGTESSTGSGYELMEEGAPPGLGPSSAASSTISDAHPEWVGAHALPNPGLPTESDHWLTGMDAPLSSPVYPTWFYPDRNLLGAHAPLPNLGTSNPRLSTEFDSDHRLVVEEPPSRPASPTEFDANNEYQVVHPPPSSPVTASPTESDHKMVDVPPSSPVSFES
jgi:hypothetical protein